MPGPLEGIRIVDITSGVAGPMATMVLGDQGAEIIKVEPPGGDPGRDHPSYVVWNRGKESVVLDLEQPADRSILFDLLATADVFVEGFEPGTLEAWGLGDDRLSTELPGLIRVSVTAYGRDLDASDRSEDDLLVQTRTGMQFEQAGFRDGPIFLPHPLASMSTSYLVLDAVCAGLYVREVTGRGQWIETSLYQGVLGFTTQLWQDVAHKPDSWMMIAKHPNPSIYECTDGLWVHSMHNAGGRGKDKSIVWTILGIDPLPMPTTPEIAAANDEALRQAFLRIPRQEVLDQFWANDLAIAPVRIAHEALADEQLVNNGMVVDIDDPVHGRTKQAGIPFRLHGAPPAKVKGPQHAVGEDTEEVLAGLASADKRARRVGPVKRELAHALDGIKVLDIGNFLAGPFGPMLLGDLGAKVYKLESPDGDQMRNVTEPFNGCQRGKFDVVADLKSPEGLEIARRLMAEVDVIHHNMRPGVAERLGVDYASAKALNPNVIYCQTTMWGIDGPRATWPGFDQLGQSSCGCEYELGGEGNPPGWYRFGMCDQACAFQSAIACLMALWWRERTGEGQFVDTSIVNGGMYFNSDVWIGPDGPIRRTRVDQEQTGLGPLYRLYRTTDRWLAVSAVADERWQALAGALGRDDLLADARFASVADRRTNAKALAAELAAVFATKDAQSWFDVLDAAGVPVEVADERATRSWMDDPKAIARGLVADYEHPTYGRFRQFGELIHFSRTPGRIWGPPPLLGQHSREVLTELRFTPEEIDDMAAKRATILA